uniref:Uncharacterized protein n=1 Tax=Anguilla anguilla TaxID=7936 RepID=A0A0E9R7C4_ANGAN
MGQKIEQNLNFCVKSSANRPSWTGCPAKAPALSAVDL